MIGDLTLKIGYHPLNKKHLELHLSSFFQLDGSIIDNVEVDNINKNEIIRVNNIDGKNPGIYQRHCLKPILSYGVFQDIL